MPSSAEADLDHPQCRTIEPHWKPLGLQALEGPLRESTAAPHHRRSVYPFLPLAAAVPAWPAPARGGGGAPRGRGLDDIPPARQLLYLALTVFLCNIALHPRLRLAPRCAHPPHGARPSKAEANTCPPLRPHAGLRACRHCRCPRQCAHRNRRRRRVARAAHEGPSRSRAPAPESGSSVAEDTAYPAREHASVPSCRPERHAQARIQRSRSTDGAHGTVGRAYDSIQAAERRARGYVASAIGSEPAAGKHRTAAADVKESSAQAARGHFWSAVSDAGEAAFVAVRSWHHGPFSHRSMGGANHTSETHVAINPAMRMARRDWKEITRFTTGVRGAPYDTNVYAAIPLYHRYLDHTGHTHALKSVACCYEILGRRLLLCYVLPEVYDSGIQIVDVQGKTRWIDLMTGGCYST